MPLVNGVWIPTLAPKQLQVFNNTSRALLVSGPRFSGKTWSVLHKVCRHLWETDGARIGLFSKTVKSAKEGGVWEDLTRYTIPEWLDANLEGANPDVTFRYTLEPCVTGFTRTATLRIMNYYGTESELLLYSLDYDGDVEAKVKNLRFSMMWFSELTNFNDRKVFVVSKQQLRMPHLRLDQHQWIADTNPSEDGEDCWIYKLWYQERTMQEFPDYLQSEDEKKGFRVLQRQLDVVEIMIDDNPFLSEEKKMEIKADHAFDRDLYERAVNGKWVSGTAKNRLFTDKYKPIIHRVGDCSSIREGEWEVILPSSTCFELITGWDLGDTYHSAHILEKVILKNLVHWVVLDELVVLEERMSVEDFTILFLEKIRWMEQAAKWARDAGQTERPITWRHYSDDSINRYRSAVDDIDRNLVFKASGEKVELEGVPKPEGSVQARVYLLRRLLHENRIRFSAQCTATHDMLRRAQKGRSKSEPVRRDSHKHAFDSLTYPIIMESSWDAAAPKNVIVPKDRIIALDLA